MTWTRCKMFRNGTKYGSRKVTVDGLVFDSVAEARHWQTLKLQEEAGTITNLRAHPVFTLQPGFRDNQGRWQRAITYVADFAYLLPPDGRLVVVDVKALDRKTGLARMTEAARIKTKMFQFRFRDVILEIVRL